MQMEIGQYVIVRARDAGVHAGEYVSHSGREVVLNNARRLWYWRAVKSISLNGVAEFGLGDGSKIGPVVKELIILDACEIISTTEAGENSIKDYANA
jgi:hypothetical protein